MRQTMQTRLERGAPDIEQLEFGPKSRDDSQKLLRVRLGREHRSTLSSVGLFQNENRVMQPKYKVIERFVTLWMKLFRATRNS